MAKFKIGQGYDVHALASGLPMRLAGVDIPFDKGFVAHSDGDVAIHALCDAVLGALAMGDIGKHFPDNDPAYKGIDSMILLGKVTKMMQEQGYCIGNVDITIALQEPKIRPYIDTMRHTLSTVLGCDADCVSIKATTTEKMGFVGRGDGCEVWAVCLLEKLI